jgi:very-short-patch-repair endonuclease
VSIEVAAAVGEDGWATTHDLLTRVSRRTITSWVAEGKLVRLRPGALALPQSAAQWRTRLAAELDHRDAVASHVTALALWGLIEHPRGPVHVTVALGQSARGSRNVVLHRSAGVYADRRRAEGLPVTSVERSLVDAWGSPAPLRRSALRPAIIGAVRRRMCSAGDVAVELARRPRLAGRGELTQLVALMADGCQSELEIWGCLEVLRAPGMPSFVQQRRVVVAGQTFFLDVAYDEVMLAVEMDGAAWHGSREQRERDIRRDALLATAGWQTLRFSYRRLTAAADACRRNIVETHAARRRLLLGDRVH